jgi:hypothetical protein
MCVILLMRKQVIINSRLNHDDTDHVLIITIDVDSQTDERSGRAFSEMVWAAVPWNHRHDSCAYKYAHVYDYDPPYNLTLA